MAYQLIMTMVNRNYEINKCMR